MRTRQPIVRAIVAGVLAAPASTACGPADGDGLAGGETATVETASGAVAALAAEAGSTPAPASHLFVWAADGDAADTDFLAVIGADPGSPDYGRVVATAPVGLTGMAHHTEHAMPEGDLLFANAFRAGASFVFDLSDPENPTVGSTFTNAGPYTFPHSFERLPNGGVLATFQTQAEGNLEAGGLVELDSLGRYVRGSDAANDVQPTVRPYSLAILPDRDRVVTTTTDMRSEVPVATSVQIWRLADLALLHTIPLPESPAGAHWLPAEPRVLPDGTVIVTTFACGMFLLEGVETDAPRARLVASFPWENPRECALPVIRGRYWVQTNATTHSLVSLDMSDPAEPEIVDELVLDADAEPHWISIEPGGDRIVLTGPGSLRGRVLLVRLDPENGALGLIEDFRDPGSDGPGVSFGRTEWPHGATGAAVPHGAVFSRR
ncbi:MAG: hypothetical protein R3195_08000 [Gemmatimonadota bacterium]|nr:hypothetical protein [Gemmatimonadota bacterium]